MPVDFDGIKKDAEIAELHQKCVYALKDCDTIEITFRQNNNCLRNVSFKKSAAPEAVDALNQVFNKSISTRLGCIIGATQAI